MLNKQSLHARNKEFCSFFHPSVDNNYFPGGIIMIFFTRQHVEAVILSVVFPSTGYSQENVPFILKASAEEIIVPCRAARKHSHPVFQTPV